MARSARLGVRKTIEVPGGRIAYHERGDGPPVLFVHGLLVNADLWRNVVPLVADAGFRCIAPDFPLGSHEVAMAADADMSMRGVAKLINEVLGALDLDDVTVVANDTGGALTQILMADDAGSADLGDHASRIGRVVLTSVDAFERMLPPMFGFVSLPVVAKLPGSMALLGALQRPYRPYIRLFNYLGLIKRPVPREIADSYTEPLRRNKFVRRDIRKFLLDVHRRHTLAAAEKLGGFTKPVLLAWAADDVIFPVSLAYRLAAVLPNATVVEIADSYTLVPEDQPSRLAELVIDFARAGDQVRN
ncbi:MAG: alpha/beta fold hydrolase [Sciscionella sp.]|nr:alpha/beta fold hydrolase [Sciscionella sp.]